MTESVDGWYHCLVNKRLESTQARPEQEEMGLRQRKKTQTREAIEAVAFELFSERGFEKTTVENIAERAMVSPRTFFRYFVSKEDVLFAGEREEIRRAGRLLEERGAQESLLESLEAILGSLAREYALDRKRRLARAELISGHPGLLSAYMGLMRDLEAEVAHFLSRRLGPTTAGGDVRLLAAVFVAVYRSSILEWAEAGGKSNLPNVIVANLKKLTEGLLRV